jgi:hypothetical protein
MIFLRLRKKTRIADLAAGSVATITGVVQSTHRLTIPPSGTACVYYALMEERFGHGERGRGRPLWFPDKFENKCVDFTVTDDSGTITVRESSERLKVRGGHREAGPVKGSKKRRFVAEFLHAGDAVVLRGRVDRSPDGAGFVLGAPEAGDLAIAITRQG